MGRANRSRGARGWWDASASPTDLDRDRGVGEVGDGSERRGVDHHVRRARRRERSPWCRSTERLLARFTMVTSLPPVTPGTMQVLAGDAAAERRLGRDAVDQGARRGRRSRPGRRRRALVGSVEEHRRDLAVGVDRRGRATARCSFGSASATARRRVRRRRRHRFRRLRGSVPTEFSRRVGPPQRRQRQQCQCGRCDEAAPVGVGECHGFRRRCPCDEEVPAARSV